MGTFLTMVVGAIGGLFKSGVDAWRESRQHAAELKKLQKQKELAIEENKIKLAQSETEYNSAIAMNNLSKSSGLGGIFLFVLAILLATPYLLIIFMPEAVGQYFELLKTMIPEWYHNMMIGIILAMYGLRKLGQFYKK